jgi:putative membrane protein
MSFKLILILIIAGLTVIFITQNVVAVDVTFLFWSISMSRALLIFFVLMIGFVLGWFLHSYLTYRKSKDEPTDAAYPPG